MVPKASRQRQQSSPVVFAADGWPSSPMSCVDEKPASLPLAGFDIEKAARRPLSDNDLFGARGATWPISSQARDASRALPLRISACDHQVSSRVARCPASAVYKRTRG